MILDTSVLVAAERRRLRFEDLLRALGGESVAIAAITATELLHGYHRATDRSVRARRSAFVEGVLEAVPVLPYGVPEARRHAEIWAELAREGTLIGPYDLLVGATALARGHSLATLNRDELARIHGLRLVPTERFQ